MSYNGPSGSSKTPAPHPSLPARPGGPLPILDKSFQFAAPVKQPTGYTPGYARGHGNTTAPAPAAQQGQGQMNGGPNMFRPRSVAMPPASQGWQQQNYAPTVSAPAISSPAIPNNYAGYNSNSNNGYQAPPQPQPDYYQQQQQYGNYANPGYSTPSPAPTPQIKNPFAAPSQGGGAGYPGAPHDPEVEAQIQAWQSAYMGKDSEGKGAGGKTEGQGGNANLTPLGGRVNIGPVLSSAEIAAAAPTASKAAAVVAGADGKVATVVRSGGGKTWQDDSLLEWNPAHPRLFIGNLAGEVTDDSLFKAFSKYTSIVKTKVVRDKKSTKSKGYGFVSFQSADDYLMAFKDMQGKYIGSHPILIKKSNTEIKATDPHKNKQHGKYNRGNNKNRDATSANTGAGVKKSGNKQTRDGMVLLG